MPILAEKRNQVARQPGVIQRFAEVLRTAAGPHVKAMYGETCEKSAVGQTDDVARLPAAFESVHERELTASITLRALGFDQNLNIGFGLDEAPFDGKAVEIEMTWPEIAQQSKDVRVANQRNEVQPVSLAGASERV